MLAALIGGERDPGALAQLARTRMRRKISVLEEAFTGRFTDPGQVMKVRSRSHAVHPEAAEP